MSLSTADVEHIADWLDSLELSQWEQVMACIEVLRDHGPQLGRPLVDHVSGSRHKKHDGTQAEFVLPRCAEGALRFRSRAQSHRSCSG